MPVAESVPQTPRRKNLDFTGKRGVETDELLKGSNNEMLRKGDYTRAAVVVVLRARKGECLLVDPSVKETCVNVVMVATGACVWMCMG